MRGAQMERYRQGLLEAGMLEPTRKGSGGHWLFYRPVTALTAFVVNLRERECGVEVVYGYASTAFTRMAGDENALVEGGVSDENITIREKLVIRDGAGESAAAARIGEMYRRYRRAEKEELLHQAKEKRSAFIRQIAGKLKPLGFKKKASTWTRGLDGDFYVMFNAQKSGYSDEYYFNVYIGKNGTNRYGDCFYTRLHPPRMCPMDWQAVSGAEFERFLDGTVVPALEEIIGTPLTELGKKPRIWNGCACDRKKCGDCWGERNLWEIG